MPATRPAPARASCPLCTAGRTAAFRRAHDRDYLECFDCGLVFLAPDQRLDAAAERRHYTTHQNRPEDAGYRGFLARLAVPLVERLKPGSQGLDYGSGPGPTLSVMLTELGFTVAVFDPFFAPDRAVLDRSYDFVTCSEAAEHFHHPAIEFARLDRLLRPGGWLALMTEILTDDRPFETWYYPRDPTHVCFYRNRSLDSIATRFGWRVESPRPNVALFLKPG